MRSDHVFMLIFQADPKTTPTINATTPMSSPPKPSTPKPSTSKLSTPKTLRTNSTQTALTIMATESPMKEMAFLLSTKYYKNIPMVIGLNGECSENNVSDVLNTVQVKLMIILPSLTIQIPTFMDHVRHL